MDNEKRQLIRADYLTGTCTQQDLAQKYGVTRSSINRAVGSAFSENIIYVKQRLRQLKKLKARDDVPSAPRLFDARRGSQRRCPSCGGMVYMPCLLCQINSAKNSQKLKYK